MHKKYTDSSNILIAFLGDKGWQHQSCTICGKSFFHKTSIKPSMSSCGWRKCHDETLPFQALSSSKKLQTPAQINDKIKNYFVATGLDVNVPQNIANLHGKTDLIVAGVQIFDSIIHQNLPVKKGNMFIAQPCVRMKFQPQVAKSEGTSTSFINICTEEMEGTFDDHLCNIDHWLTILSKLGLHMNNFTIVLRTSTKNWGTGEFVALEIFFSYGGLELGDASYFSIPQTTRSAISISDIGFGLERITWAVNKIDSYYDLLSPWTILSTKEIFDSCRTVTLLAINGVRASNKGPGLQLRRLAKIISSKSYNEDIYYLFRYYFDYWSNFIQPSKDIEEVIQILRLEIERFINLSISKTYKLPVPRVETTEEYLNRLVNDFNIHPKKIIEILKKCKN